MGKKSGIPNGWLDYSKHGERVPGTNFVPFKVPLKQALLRGKVAPAQWFTTQDLLEAMPQIKLVINLTNTTDGRYYDYKDLRAKGINIVCLPCAGQGTLPPEHIITRFFQAVDEFRATSGETDGLVGVHCTHGLNRTGYLICKYMVDRLGVAADEAIGLFEKARGHKIVRQQYISALIGHSPKAAAKTDNVANWREQRSVGQQDTRNYNDLRSAMPNNSYSQPRNDYFNSYSQPRSEHSQQPARNYAFEHRSPLDSAYDDAPSSYGRNSYSRRPYNPSRFN